MGLWSYTKATFSCLSSVSAEADAANSAARGGNYSLLGLGLFFRCIKTLVMVAFWPVVFVWSIIVLAFKIIFFPIRIFLPKKSNEE